MRINKAVSINLSIINNKNRSLWFCTDVNAMSGAKCPLTSHFSFKENKVLKKNTIQIIGQMMRPSQKMRASASVAAILFAETCCGKVIRAIIFVYFARASAMHWAPAAMGFVQGGHHICTKPRRNPQKHPTAISPILVWLVMENTFLASKIQWLFPSSSIWFHQRRPTMSLPVTFWRKQTKWLNADHR